MTQISDAKKGILTDEMKHVAEIEGVSEDFILKSVAEGTIVIPSNVNRDIEASGIGAGLRTKVNATVGTSTDIVDFDEEVYKAQVAIDNGADCLMELSIGGDLDVIRNRVLDMSPLPVGSVPVYQAAIETIREEGSVVYMDEDKLFNTIEKQAKDGIDFMAVHSSINIETLTRLKRQGRVTGLVSRGGSLFGNEKDGSFKSALGAVYQSFGGQDLYPSSQEKAANLLYLVTKDHGFSDGNKRIAAGLFLYFLKRNRLLFRKDGSKRIADHTLVALTVMIAESKPQEKELMVNLVMTFLK